MKSNNRKMGNDLPFYVIVNLPSRCASEFMIEDELRGEQSLGIDFQNIEASQCISRLSTER